MTSPYLDRPVRSYAQAVAERRYVRRHAAADAVSLEVAMEAATEFRARVHALTGHLHVDAARSCMAQFDVLFDDLLGDTIGGALKKVEDAIDDTMPAGVP